jgi:hypothetical protein
MVPLPLAPYAAFEYQKHHEREVASLGGPLEGCLQGYRFPVSDHFSTNDLRTLCDTLNSAAFQAPLTNYSCGDPVPKFSFAVTLIRYPDRQTNFLAVDWAFCPHIEFRDRGVDAGLMYLVEKAFGKMEAARPWTPPNEPLRFQGFRVVYEPHVDCSRRPAVGQTVQDFIAARPRQEDWDWVTLNDSPEEILW